MHSRLCLKSKFRSIVSRIVKKFFSLLQVATIFFFREKFQATSKISMKNILTKWKSHCLQIRSLVDWLASVYVNCNILTTHDRHVWLIKRNDFSRMYKFKSRIGTIPKFAKHTRSWSRDDGKRWQEFVSLETKTKKKKKKKKKERRRGGREFS